MDYAQEFDGVSLSIQDLAVSPREIENSVPAVEADVAAAVGVAIKNIEAFHRHQTIPSYTHIGEYGEKLTQKVDAIESVAVYIPGGAGGNTPLISTLLMNVIPAKIAGCKRIIGLSPPTPEKSLNPNLLYAFKQLGIKEIYKVGGAQAIAAAAYGTDTIKQCDIIVGPGNAYVTMAKKLVYGDVMIDGVFGPSEIVIISDGSGNPSFVASDLISQAEHAGDELSVLLTTDSDFANSVEAQVENMLKTLARRDIIAQSLVGGGAIMLVDSLDQAVAISNQIAPEHLELSIKNPHAYIDQVTQAGAVFVGHLAPEPIGDYIAGTNHVLPTQGAARFASPLGVYHFLKRKNIIEYNPEAFAAYAPKAMTLAKAEKLTAHLQSLKIRDEK